MLAFALIAASATALLLPSAGFLGRAFVIASDRPPSPASEAIEAFVSNSVISRAAASLIDAGFDVPAPDTVEKVGVALGIAGSKPTGGEARLALDLAHAIDLHADEASGNLRIEAVSPDAKNATQIATAVAFAFVAEQDDLAAKARRQGEADLAARVERLKADASAARRKLGELGGIEADPAQVRAAAAAQTAAAQSRVDTIRTIIASSNPPLSDRRDVPPAIETVQATYLDLSRQLAKARETLGDRHTTIISLQDGVRRAAAGLNTEWKRLAHIAEGELQAARAREASLSKALSPADAKRRDAILEARHRVQAADDALARAQAGLQGGALPATAHLSARPALSALPVGYGWPLRASIALLVGVLAFILGKLGRFGAAAWRDREASAADTVDEPIAIMEQNQRPIVGFPPKARETSRRETPDPARRARADDMMPAMLDLLRGARPISALFGGVPTIMVASLEADLATTPAALALGRAAVREGRRVLIIEANRPQTMLAASAADGDPILVDFFGSLLVALPAAAPGDLSIVPCLDKGDDYAAALARRGDTPIIEDLSDAFDLIVVDGGRAEDCAAAGWGADAYLRVGRSASASADERILAIFEAPEADLLGLVVGTSVLPRVVAKAQPADWQDATRRPHGRRAHIPAKSTPGATASAQVYDIGRRPKKARR